MKTIPEEYLSSRLPILYNNKLCRLIGIGNGRIFHLEYIEDKDKNKCPHCGLPIETRFNLLEHSLLFQNGIELLHKD
jgi:hypothetical protein